MRVESERKIALLIDADNVSPKYIQFIVEEVANHGILTYKRIYGDWTRPQMGAWKEVLLEYSIIPVQQYQYTTGKNSTDSALIIDAMDVLYTKGVEGFCIVSSDSDCTRLAARLREAGMYVLGMGEKKTPRAFIVACEQFKYLEALSAPVQIEEEEEPEGEPQAIDDIGQLTKSLQKIISEISDEDGWAYMGDLGNMLSKRYPDFDTRNYGFRKLTSLVSSIKKFEVMSQKTSNPRVTRKYVRNKRKRK